MKNILVLFTIFLTFFSSCQKKETQETRKLTLNFQEGDLPSLHPHDLMIHLRGLSIAKTLYEGLTRIDETGKAVLTGAESYQVSPNGMCYTFTLRPNSWSDGAPVLATQYEAAWKEALSPSSDCSRADLLYMIRNAEAAKRGDVPVEEVGIKALDEMTLEISLEYPSPLLLELLAQPICFPLIHPQEKQMHAFNGPFVVDIWAKGDKINLKPNPLFWNCESVGLDEIEVYMIEDSMTAYALFEKEELDWVGLPLSPLTTEMLTRLENQEKLYSHPVDRAFWIFLNTEHPVLSSAKIRQALNLALDRKSITDHILKGGTPLEKSLPFSLLSIIPPHLFSKNEALAQIKLAEGLEEIGYTKEDLPPLVITYSQQANRKQVAEYLQESWMKTLGIPIQLKSEEWNVLRSNLEKGEYIISAAYEAAFYNDPLELLERFITINPCNFPRWTHPEFGKLVTEAKYETDQERRLELLSKAEQLMMEELPFIPVSTDTLFFTHPEGLTGYCFDFVGAVDFSKASFSGRR
ncbi:MAG: Oligopeptide-binding protein OppA [Chlamydiae bacterium]|nr:Oligopeptide-binding protein OppA [Chlamydiota bacterium]